MSCLWSFTCLLALLTCLPPTKSSNVPFLVFYDGYYAPAYRRSILEASVAGEVFIEPRQTIFSDFDRVWVPKDVSRTINESSTDPKNGSDGKVGGRITAWYRDKEIVVRRPKGTLPRPGRRAPHYLDIRQVADVLRADRLWAKGVHGEGVDVAVFDTGLTRRRTFFRNVKSVIDFTTEGNPTDSVGHGTFVAGLIASSRRRCSGLAPKANLHIFKVFTSAQTSNTAWFLDAFNAAIQRRVHVINLSIGGPDFTDKPFLAKVSEVTANGIIMISAIGNDGPGYGTLNNPADQGNVIGVGGINLEDRLSKFSSRGMTTWELPGGYGRLKPDIVTYGVQVYGPSINGGCRALSGTSVAAPVVTGAVALLLSSLDEGSRRNVGRIKQCLMESAMRLQNVVPAFEQGAGKLDLPAAYFYLHRNDPDFYDPHVSLYPSYVDFTECPYMWPYCTQPLYHGALPIIVNVTILNGYGVDGRIVGDPVFEGIPGTDHHGNLLEVTVTHSPRIYPWAGFVAAHIRVSSVGATFDGTVTGRLTLSVITGGFLANATMLIRVRIIPTPPREKRVLWDQYRNLNYPPGYFARDDLRQVQNPLDWNADHPHTNFRALYEALRGAGYFLEISGGPLVCVELNDYSTLLIFDPEDEFHPEEVSHVEKAVSKGLNLIVAGEWFNASLVKKIQFYDENTQQWWYPETGGANIPALNALLDVFGFAFGDLVVESSDVVIGGRKISYLSGAIVTHAPKTASVILADVNDVASELAFSTKSTLRGAILATAPHFRGHVSLFGDTSCLEDATCFELLDGLIKRDFSVIKDDLQPSTLLNLPDSNLPTRITTSNFAKYSKVISGFSAPPSEAPIFRSLPSCPAWVPQPLRLVENVTVPSSLEQRGHLDVIEIERIFGPRLLSNFDALLDENAAGLPLDDDESFFDVGEWRVFKTLAFIAIILFAFTSFILAHPRSFISRYIRVAISRVFRLFFT